MSVIIPFEILYNRAGAVIESRVPVLLVHLLRTGAAVVHKVLCDEEEAREKERERSGRSMKSEECSI